MANILESIKKDLSSDSCEILYILPFEGRISKNVIFENIKLEYFGGRLTNITAGEKNFYGGEQYGSWFDGSTDEEVAVETLLDIIKKEGKL